MLLVLVRAIFVAVIAGFGVRTATIVGENQLANPYVLFIGVMLAATAIGIFFIPAIFYLVETVSGAARARGNAPELLPSPGQGD